LNVHSNCNVGDDDDADITYEDFFGKRDVTGREEEQGENRKQAMSDDEVEEAIQSNARGLFDEEDDAGSLCVFTQLHKINGRRCREHRTSLNL
jgi:U3 small nucleolar ribonucleoprotein component